MFLDLSPPALVISDFLAYMTYFMRDMSLPAADVLYEKSQFSLTRSHGLFPLRCSSLSEKNAPSFSELVFLLCSICFPRSFLRPAKVSSAPALRARFCSCSASYFKKRARLRSCESSSTWAISCCSSSVKSDSGCCCPPKPTVGAAFWKGSSLVPWAIIPPPVIKSELPDASSPIKSRGY
jgi:hypothetical protein